MPKKKNEYSRILVVTDGVFLPELYLWEMEALLSARFPLPGGPRQGERDNEQLKGSEDAEGPSVQLCEPRSCIRRLGVEPGTGCC